MCIVSLIIISFLFVIIIMSTKKISINPDFFKLTSVASKKDKKKKKE